MRERQHTCATKTPRDGRLPNTDALDRIHAHDALAVFGQTGPVGPIEFFVRNWYNILFELESKSVLLAQKIYKGVCWSR
jgi:hypothetical protein